MPLFLVAVCYEDDAWEDDASSGVRVRSRVPAPSGGSAAADVGGEEKGGEEDEKTESDSDGIT